MQGECNTLIFTQPCHLTCSTKANICKHARYFSIIDDKTVVNGCMLKSIIEPFTKKGPDVSDINVIDLYHVQPTKYLLTYLPFVNGHAHGSE